MLRAWRNHPDALHWQNFGVWRWSECVGYQERDVQIEQSDGVGICVTVDRLLAAVTIEERIAGCLCGEMAQHCGEMCVRTIQWLARTLCHRCFGANCTYPHFTIEDWHTKLYGHKLKVYCFLASHPVLGLLDELSTFNILMNRCLVPPLRMKKPYEKALNFVFDKAFSPY